jgi:hypothetical protein
MQVHVNIPIPTHPAFVRIQLTFIAAAVPLPVGFGTCAAFALYQLRQDVRASHATVIGQVKKEGRV